MEQYNNNKSEPGLRQVIVEVYSRHYGIPSMSVYSLSIQDPDSSCDTGIFKVQHNGITLGGRFYDGAQFAEEGSKILLDHAVGLREWVEPYPVWVFMYQDNGLTHVTTNLTYTGRMKAMPTKDGFMRMESELKEIFLDLVKNP